MVFEFSNYVLDIDVDETRNFYITARSISKGCSCSGCRNYEKAMDFVSKEVNSFFSQLGIDVKKPCEVYVNCTNTDNSVLYSGLYHVCGKMISGESAFISTGPNSKYLDEKRLLTLTRDFRVFFQRELLLLEDSFPLPAIQLEILANIPWVIKERNEYPIVTE